MAKRKVVTPNSAKQGQTVYWIDRHWEKGPESNPELKKIFLHSHKTPLPAV